MRAVFVDCLPLSGRREPNLELPEPLVDHFRGRSRGAGGGRRAGSLRGATRGVRPGSRRSGSTARWGVLRATGPRRPLRSSVYFGSLVGVGGNYFASFLISKQMAVLTSDTGQRPTRGPLRREENSFCRKVTFW